MKTILFYSANRLCSGPAGIEDLKKHPFFASIDWNKLLNKEVNKLVQSFLIFDLGTTQDIFIKSLAVSRF